jgi:site-specific DNA recombinase
MYAEMKGWTVLTVYHLEAVSGKTVIEEPETKRMLEDVRTGRISGLIFSQLFRLGRNTRELLELADFFQEHNADLISLAESIDTSTPIGRMFYTVTAAVGQCDREMTAARVAASVPIRAKMGKPLGGAAPFGYQWQGANLIPHPEEAPIRRLIYELYREHRRLTTVARLLTEAGHRTRNGSAFSHTTVERLIRDPTAKGKRRANYTKSLGMGRKWTVKPESEWVWLDVEPVVSEALWEECNRFLVGKREGHRPVAKKTVHLFAGVTVCATCGGKMYVPSNTPKYVCKACRTKIPIVDLERIFEEQLRGFFVSPKSVAEHVAQADQQLQDREALLTTLKRDLKKVEAEMQKVYDLYLEDHISAQGFGVIYRPLEERASQLQGEIPRLQGEADFLRIQHMTKDTVLVEATDLYGRWGSLSFEERRAIVETVVERITVGKEEVAVELAYLLSPPEMVAKGARNGTDSSRRAGRTGPGTESGRGSGRR